jgi:dolichol-phosphate mannosyltransferase
VNRSLSVIVPVFNEANSIESSIKKLSSFLSSKKFDYQIIIIESGSTDETYSKCLNLKNYNKRILLIRENKRNGYGSALKAGIKGAKKKYTTFFHPDIPYDIKYIKRIYEYTKKFNYIFSYRSKADQTFFRKLQSVTYNYFVKKLFDLNIKNVNSLLKIIKTSFLKKVNLVSNGWTIDLEILIEIKKIQSSYIEVPVPLNRRFNDSSKITLFTPFKMLFDVIKLYYIKKI